MNIERPKSNQPIPENAQKVFDGIIFEIYQWQQEQFDGTLKTFEKAKRPDTVVVFPVLDDGKIILTKQEQPGKDPFIAATGGMMDRGEDVLSAAKRELLEESGYEADEFILWDAQHPASKIDYVVYTFIAKGLKKVGELKLDSGERIELMPVTLDELIGIGTQSGFNEPEIVHYLYEAKINPSVRKKLEELFKPL